MLLVDDARVVACFRMAEIGTRLAAVQHARRRDGRTHLGRTSDRSLENTVDRLQKLPGELAAFRQEFESFRKEVNTRFDEQHAHMRMLHEDLVERISLLGERKGRPPKPRR